MKNSRKNSYICHKAIILNICFILFFVIKISSQETLAEKLGYQKDAKLLIVHADDLGFAHSENVASIRAIEMGSVNSASIIMTGAWVKEVATYANENKISHDLGLHLAITSEWKNFKWGPVASKDKVPSLINEYGHFYDSCPSNANVTEIETELRAQIELAYSYGIVPTHLDSHMGCLFWGKLEFFEIYLRLAKEYNLPCLVDKSFASLFPDEESFNKMLKKQEVMVMVDYNFTISVEENRSGPEDYYTKIISNLEPGLTQILIHTAYDNVEMQAITVDHPDWGSAWRQADYDFFTSSTCKQLIKDKNIVLVTWREIASVLKK